MILGPLLPLRLHDPDTWVYTHGQTTRDDRVEPGNALLLDMASSQGYWVILRRYLTHVLTVIICYAELTRCAGLLLYNGIVSGL